MVILRDRGNPEYTSTSDESVEHFSVMNGDRTNDFNGVEMLTVPWLRELEAKLTGGENNALCTDC